MIWLVLGCSEVDPDFALARADAICARHARCGTLETAGFASEEACVEALESAAAALRRQYGLDCDRWSGGAAQRCLASGRGHHTTRKQRSASSPKA